MIFAITYENEHTLFFNQDGKKVAQLNQPVNSSDCNKLQVGSDYPLNFINNNTLKKQFPQDFESVLKVEDAPLYKACRNNLCGFINEKGKIIKPLKYTRIEDLRDHNEENLLQLFTENTYEIFDAKTQKTTYKINTNGIRLFNKEGILRFGKDAYIDQYGNYWQEFVEPQKHPIQYEK